MKEEVKKIINDEIKRKLGITYDEFEKLNFYEQQRIIEQHRKKKKSNSKYVRVMIGSGEYSMFVKKKRGERYMRDDGTFAIAGNTIEDSRKRLDDMIDDAMYSKPIAFVKKLTRKIKNR